MAMLLRTRSKKISLGLRVCTVLLVTATYVIIAAVSRDVPQNSTKQASETGLHYQGRHLLTLVEGFNCTPPAIHEFPSDGFTREQRQHGWAILHAVLACYCFVLLAIVCDDYFVPAIKNLCDLCNMSEDIAGATFMATASSSPELFINSVGTFITEGDLGVGTIVGSSVFNILAVPACCGLFGNMVLQLDWWPLTRDSIMYGISVVLLIIVLYDEKITTYEAMSLVLAYIAYIFMMYFNNSISRGAHRVYAKCRSKRNYTEIMGENQPLLLDGKENGIASEHEKIMDTELTLKDCEELDESTKIWQWPSEASFFGKTFWVLTWPISFILQITIPDCRKHSKLTIITFLMCIIWIGFTSYFVAWLITVVGDTLNIPDSVMGLTFLAAGTSVPEAVSSVIVTNQGHGSMGLSSSIGSNTFDILLCLGIPWLIKTSLYPKDPEHNWIIINSTGLMYSAVSLLTTLCMLYCSILFNRFQLNWKVGLTCLLMYIGFLIFASLIELNVFFTVNLPTCER